VAVAPWRMITGIVNRLMIATTGHRRLFGIAFLSICLFAQSAWTAWVATPNVDEVGLLAAGVHHWTEGRFDLYRVNPPLVKLVAALPIVLMNPSLNWRNVRSTIGARTEWQVGNDFLKVNPGRAMPFIRAARLSVIPFSLLGMLLCFLWSRDLWGETAGLFSAALWCFSPTIVTWSSTITSDVPAAALAAGASYCFWKHFQSGWTRYGIAAGVALGFACLAKFTCLLLFPLWLSLVFITRNGSWGVRLRSIIAIKVVAILIINAGYCFERTCECVGDFVFVSRTLAGSESLLDGGPGGNLSARSWLGGMPVPLPANMLIGMDLQKFDFERGTRNFLLGEWKSGGWWYYYVIAFLVKEPVGTLLLIVLATVEHFRRRTADAGVRQSEWLLCILGGGIFALVSSQTGICRYLRYMIPAFPFLYVWMARTVCDAVSLKQKSVAWVCVVLSAASALHAVPHSLTYFNELVGGSRWGHYVLADANIDWGHDYGFLKSWIEENDDARPICLDLLPVCDLQPLGLDQYETILQQHARLQNPYLISEGWYAMSAHQMHLDDGFHRFFLNKEPSAVIGGSVYIFQVGEAAIAGD